VKKEYRPGDAAQNNMFIVAEAGVFCVCEHRQIWSIRLIRDASVGIPWIGSGAAGKANFMLVREVSDSVDMVIPGMVGYYYNSKRTVKRPHREIQLINVL
jgi:hypothetical protein